MSKVTIIRELVNGNLAVERSEWSAIVEPDGNVHFAPKGRDAFRTDEIESMLSEVATAAMDWKGRRIAKVIDNL